MPKNMCHFDPVTNRSLAENDQHYSEIHTRFVRGMFRHNAPALNRYVAHHALAQYSIARKFNAKPRAWRFVVLDFQGDDWHPEGFQDILSYDHTNCLRNARAFDVEDEMILDNLNGQTSTQKYLIEHDTRAGESVEDAHAWYEGTYLPMMTQMLDDSFGFRGFTTNKVIQENDTEANEEEGQILTGTSSPTDRVRYDEIWFDNVDWAAEFFARDEVWELLFRGKLSSNAFLVDEETGIDRR